MQYTAKRAANKVMKVNVLIALFVLVIVTESRELRRRKNLDHFPDYEASGDYFEVTVRQDEVFEVTTATSKDRQQEESTTSTSSENSKTSSSSSQTATDDGVTCSASNFTDIYAGYELENHVLVIFKVNVTANESELVL